MAIVIPMRQIKTAYSMRITLEAAVYLLRFTWNTRMSTLFLDISDAAGVILLAGIPLIINYPLTYKSVGRIEGLPPGQFVVIDETGQNRNPDPDTAGADVKLLYFEAADVAAL